MIASNHLPSEEIVLSTTALFINLSNDGEAFIKEQLYTFFQCFIHRSRYKKFDVNYERF